jgi:hypothetical protein
MPAIGSGAQLNVTAIAVGCSVLVAVITVIVLVVYSRSRRSTTGSDGNATAIVGASLPSAKGRLNT